MTDKFSFTINASIFRDRLDLASRCTARGSGIMPQLACVLVEVSEATSTVMLTAFDFDRCLCAVIDPTALLEIKGTGATLVDAKVIDLLGRLPGKNAIGFLCREGDYDNDIIEISYSDPIAAKYKFQAMPADEYPAIPTVEELDCEFDLELIDLQLAIARGLLATSTDATKPVLNGVRFMASDNELRFTSTDLSRINHSQIALKENLSESIVQVVPAIILGLVASIRGESKTPVTVRIGCGRIEFHCRKATVSSRLILDSYPPKIEEFLFQAQEQDTWNFIFTADTKDLVSAVERVGVIAKYHKQQLVKLRLDLNRNLLILHAKANSQEMSAEAPKL